MKWSTHMAIGTAIGILITRKFLPIDISNNLQLIGAAGICSLIPDLDHPKSKINQRLLLFKNKSFKTFIYLAVGIGLMYLGFKYGNRSVKLTGMGCSLIGISHHRGFTHSLLGVVLFIGILYSGVYKTGHTSIFLGGMIGYLSHLTADFFTSSGIELFYPYYKNYKAPITLTTGGRIERIIVTLAIGYICIDCLRYIGTHLSIMSLS